MIDVRKAGEHAVVTLAELDRLNADDAAHARRLADDMFDVLDDDDVKAVVIRADGDDFCPSVDRPVPSAPRGAAWVNAFAGPRSLPQVLTFSKKVVIAEVRGACTGAGVGIVLAADLAVAAADATFAAPFVERAEVNYALAALTMRTHRARAWALSATPWTAEDALRSGLVNEVHAVEAVADRAEQMAEEAARTPLDGITIAKMMRQAVLDTQGVGQEFDAVPLLVASQFHGAHAGAS